MSRFIALFIALSLIFATCTADICKNNVGDDLKGGMCYVTSHALTRPLESSDTAWADPEIKEFHFHVYWHQHRPESYAAALRIQAELLTAVFEGEFLVVLPGITEELVPGIDESQIPGINTEPIGPHPCGSFETWVPKEYFAEAMNFFMQRRGELTILIHPRSAHEVEDHASRNMWLGPPMRLDLTALPEDIGHIPLQYPELKLGYSAPEKLS